MNEGQVGEELNIKHWQISHFTPFGSMARIEARGLRRGIRRVISRASARYAPLASDYHGRPRARRARDQQLAPHPCATPYGVLLRRHLPILLRPRLPP